MGEAVVRNKTSRVIRAGSPLKADPDHPGGVAEAEAIGYAIEDVLAGATGLAWLELASDGERQRVSVTFDQLRAAAEPLGRLQMEWHGEVSVSAGEVAAVVWEGLTGERKQWVDELGSRRTGEAMD